MFLFSFVWASSWHVQFARMEGAATDIKEAALLMSTISKDIQKKQRIYRIAELAVAAQKLEQQIQSAQLALHQVKSK